MASKWLDWGGDHHGQQLASATARVAPAAIIAARLLIADVQRQHSERSPATLLAHACACVCVPAPVPVSPAGELTDRLGGVFI